LLTRSHFGGAVRDALRHFVRTDLLAANELMRAKMLTRSGPGAVTPKSLQTLIAEAAETLFANERDQKLYRVLDLTYFNPVPKREAAAERLGLSFSTYRRYLTTGINRLSEWLWQQEQEALRLETRAEQAGATVAGEERASPSETGFAVLRLPDKASIAVLPFQNLSGDPEQEYFADGMVEEIITALSWIKWLFVIARNSSFTYKGQTIDVKQVGRELGVRYVLEGSVRKAGGRVRITAQLIDAQNGAHLWADRFEGPLEDVFELQDKVALNVAGVIEPTLQVAETARSAGRPTKDLTAYDLYLRAYALYLSSAKQIPEALHLMERAVERDPRFGPALAWAAVCYFRSCADGWSDDPVADSRKGTDLALRALQVAGDDPGILANAAAALAFFGRDIGAMMALVDRALVLNPSFARGWFISGNLRIYAGQPEVAIEHVEVSLRLSPRARIGWAFYLIGIALFFSRRSDEAVPKLLLAIHEDPSFPAPYRCLAACYAHMGRLDEAREIVTRLRAITPAVMPSVIPYRNPEHRELYLSGLRLAMGEET
jgi:TolB-like protein